MNLEYFVSLDVVEEEEHRTTYVFDQCTLVFEGVTLAQLVKLVVEVLVDLPSSTVFDKKTSENTQTSHPQDLTVNPYPSIKAPSHRSSTSCVIVWIHHT